MRFYQKAFNGNDTYDLMLNPYEIEVGIYGSDSTHNPSFLSKKDQTFVYVTDLYANGFCNYAN